MKKVLSFIYTPEKKPSIGSEFRKTLTLQGYDLEEIRSLDNATSDEQKQAVVEQFKTTPRSSWNNPAVPATQTHTPTLSPRISPRLTEEQKVMDKFIEVDDPNNITLLQLNQLYDILKEHEDDHYTYFLDKKNGMGQIHRCVSALLSPYSGGQGEQWSETLVKIQFLLVK
ncbi:forF, partial [Acrasis kona]